MKKFYSFALAAAAVLSASAASQESLMKRQADAIGQRPALNLRTGQKHTSMKAPAKASEEAAWGEWEMAGTGVFTLDSGFEDYLGISEWTGEFPDINVYSRTDAANPAAMQYKLEGVFNNADLIVDYDSESGLCKVLPQSTNIEIEEGAIIQVVDLATLFDLYGEEWLGLPPEEVESIVEYYSQYNYFVPELGRFYLYLGYTMDGYEDALAITDTTFQLDGVEDMSVSVETEAFYKDASDMKGFINFGPSVAKCNYNCFSGILTQQMINDVVNGEEGVRTIDKSSEIDLIASEGNGMYTVVAVTYSADGTPLEWDYDQYTFTPSSSEGWTLLGKGLYTSDLMESLFGEEEVSYEVDVERNNVNPGLIRIVNPYGPASPYYTDEYVDCVKNYDIYLEFDATDPDRVFFKPTNLGIDMGGGWWIAVSTGYYMGEIGGVATDASMFGILSDGRLSFPAHAVLLTCENIEELGGKPGMWYYGNQSGEFSLTLPASSAVDILDSESATASEYFNMQGVRIAGPAKGSMVIERRGGNVSKRVVR